MVACLFYLEKQEPVQCVECFDRRGFAVCLRVLTKFCAAKVRSMCTTWGWCYYVAFFFCGKSVRYASGRFENPGFDCAFHFSEAPVFLYLVDGLSSFGMATGSLVFISGLGKVKRIFLKTIILKLTLFAEYNSVSRCSLKV